MKRRSAKFIAAMDAYDADQFDEALRLMEECAREDEPVACFMMALWHQDDTHGVTNLKLSAQWLDRLERLAERGDVEAQWELGQNYRFGNVLPLDIERANHWLLRAAEGGHPEAQHHLAWYFETGQYDHVVDLAEAAKWYQRAFEQGNPETLYLYAIRLFRDGHPTEEAIKLLRMAGDQGFKQAADVLRSSTQ